MNRRGQSGWVVGSVFLTLFLLRLDFWNWNGVSFVAGFPTGFGYHIAFCVLVTAVLTWLVPRSVAADDDEAPGS